LNELAQKFSELFEKSSIVYALLGFFLVLLFSRYTSFKSSRKRRRKYYRNVFLKSRKWYQQRDRVLKRDGYRCVKCGARATEVHHKRYAKKLGTEPDKWLISICRICHEKIHA
jgi:hypothetical protein